MVAQLQLSARRESRPMPQPRQDSLGPEPPQLLFTTPRTSPAYICVIQPTLKLQVPFLLLFRLRWGRTAMQRTGGKRVSEAVAGQKLILPGAMVAASAPTAANERTGELLP
jgi:hypothetical protein